MRRRFMTVIVTVLLMTSYSAAQNVSDSELQYRDALHKQTIEGDLPSAIEIYKNIVASKTADRGVKAKALLQLAACYEKLGQKSEAVYQQIISGYPDQPAATEAKAKLASLHPATPPSTMTLRKIELGNGVQNIVATDGQRAVYWDSARTTLFFGDVAGKSKKKVYTGRPDRRPFIVASRDLSMLFFFFSDSQTATSAYAVVKTDGTGYHEIDLIDGGVKMPVLPPDCLSWSRDNRSILMCRRRGPDHLIGLLKVDAADGKVVDLLPAWPTDILDAISSPDDRFIAFEDVKGPIYVIPSRGGDPQLIVRDAVLVDWTNDGKYFVFGADQEKTFSMFALPLKDGQPAGDRIFIRAVDRGSRPISYGASMVYAKAVGIPNLKLSLSSLNADGSLSPWKPLELVGDLGFFPTWSPDGSRFAYIARTLGQRSSVLRIYTLATGEDRELLRSTNLSTCIWASKHPTIYCSQTTTPGMTDILAVGIETGRAEKVGSLDGFRVIHRLSADDRFLGTVRAESRTGHAWEIGSDKETSSPVLNESPDGRWVYRVSRDADNRRIYQIRPSGSDEDWKDLFHLRRQATPVFEAIPIRYTQDSNWIVYADTDADGKDALYRAPTNGGEPQRLGDYPAPADGSLLVPGPDGRHFLVGGSDNRRELQPPEYWMLQNFIPTAATVAGRR